MMSSVVFHDSSPRNWRLSPAFAGCKLSVTDYPGLYAPGFMLSPAPQAYSPVESLLQLFHCLIDRERSRPLARRAFLVGFEVLGDKDDAASHCRGVAEFPVVIGIRRDVRPFVWVGP